MDVDPLLEKITTFIAGRAQPKLDAFDKKAENARKEAMNRSDQEIAELEERLAVERQKLEEKYSPVAWLSDAAKRATQRQLVTHALKFTHPDAKGTSIFFPSAQAELEEQKNDSYVSTSTLGSSAIDSVGNAAALDIVSFLQLEHAGKKVVDFIRNNDPSPLRHFASDDNQLYEWLAGFRQIFVSKDLSSHKYAKQVYFPIGEDEYHLLSPLFPSSFAHAIHDRVTASRYSEEAKVARKARRESRYYENEVVEYPNTAVIHHGGTKPQNISQLNSSRGGKSFLLNCAPPVWQTIDKPPVMAKTIFSSGYYGRRVYREVGFLRYFLEKHLENSRTERIRNKRKELVDRLVDQLVIYGAEIQQLSQNAGWSGLPECRLRRSEQLWLDPRRSDLDMAFKQERERNDWQTEIADQFARWLNKRLGYSRLTLGDREYLEWKSLLKRRLRLLKDDLEDFS